jgi:ribonucleotide reductase alpha subunit
MLWCETTKNINDGLVRILRILDKKSVIIASLLAKRSAVILLLQFLGKLAWLAFVVRL